jgi:CheY-like chemotaxis protein
MGAVLLVEDDALIRIDLTEGLRDEGYDVVAATDGRDALDRLQERSDWCVILLDLKMPRMNAAEFRRHQLQNPALASIPIVLMSAVNGLAERAQELAVATYIAKPFRLAQVFAAVQHHCHGQS